MNRKIFFLSLFTGLLVFIFNSAIAPAMAEFRSFTPFASQFSRNQKNQLGYQVQPGDTLWLIANTVYGSGSKKYWTLISEANAVLTLSSGQPLIFPGQRLVIPDIPADFSSADNFLPIISKNEFINPEPQLIPSLALEHMVDDKNFLNENKYDAVTLSGAVKIGPFNYSQGVYPAMYAFIKNSDASGFSYNLNYCGDFVPNLLSSQGITKSYISECISSLLTNSHAYKLKAENKQGTNEAFYVIKDDKVVGNYFNADQLLYSPNGDQFSFRARRGDDWLVVTNQTEKKYDYVEAIFYTTGNAFYVIAKDGEDWILGKNDKIIERAYYIDSFTYLDGAADFAYRVHEKNSSSDKWFFVVRGVEQKNWDYVDKFFYHKTQKKIYYRARDENGNWFIINIDSSGKSNVVYKGFNKAGELLGVIISPTGESEFFGEYKLGDKEILLKDANSLIKKYEAIVMPAFSADGKHLGYIGYRLISPVNAEADFVVDGKYIKKICAQKDCSLNEPELLSFSFSDKNNSVIIYTYDDIRSVIIRTEYSLK